MAEYQVIVEYTSKRTFAVTAAAPDDAATQAMRQLVSDDREAGPVGYVVTLDGVAVADRRVWKAKGKRRE